MADKNIVILIASIHHREIYEQLQYLLGEQECVCISLDEVASMELEKSEYPEVVKEYKHPVIPKIIHYAWFGY